VDSWGRGFRAGHDLVRGQVLIGSIKHFKHCLPGSSDPLVLIAQQAQGCLDAWRSH
jgi:hypothetical protein